ncbi:MAG: DNA primase family protein [Promethearchaeia archaeon]
MSINHDEILETVDNFGDLRNKLETLESDDEKNKLIERFEKKRDGDDLDEDETIRDLWICQRCKTEFFLKRNKKPMECPEDQGGCGKFRTKTVFKAKTGPYQYFTFNPHPKFRPKLLGEDILGQYNYLTMKDSGDIYVFKDGIYRREGEKHIKNKAQNKLGIESESKRKNKTVDYIESATYTDRDKLNRSDLVAVQNGILDVETRSIFEPDPNEHYITMSLPVEYDSDAECPMIKDFLHDIVRDEDVKVLQELAGYTLHKSYPIAKAFMLHGSGANGKSTFLNLLEKFLGHDNVANPSLQGLLNDKFTAADLYGKLACIHADIPNQTLKYTGKFKMLTGGDTIRARRIYQDAFEFRNYAKMIFSANELPQTNDMTDAFYRRWIIIDFPYQFRDDDPETDPNIVDKITTKEELSGFLNWALDGLDRLLAQGHFSHTGNMEEMRNKWIAESDPFLGFIEEHIEESSDSMVAKEELPYVESDKPDTFYKAYKDYCNKYDKSSKNEGTVTKRLKSIITLIDQERPTLYGERVRCWKGIKIKENSPYSHLNITDEMKKPNKDQKKLGVEVVDE